MARFYPVSDLHIDTLKSQPAISSGGADVVVVAGDVCESFDSIEYLQRIDAPVLFVPGNHDLYSVGRAPQDAEDIIAGLKERARGTNVTVLHRDEAVINGTRFLGCTLWTDVCGMRSFAVALSYMMHDSRFIIQAAAWERLLNSGFANDYEREGDWQNIARQIEDGKTTKLMNGVMHAFLHDEERQWLSDRLYQPFTGETVVVTHHAPHRKSLAPYISKDRAEHIYRRLDTDTGSPHFQEDTIYARAAYYAVSTDDLLRMAGGRASVWVHGHVHSRVDYGHEGLRVLCNPRGAVGTDHMNDGLGLKHPKLVDPASGVAPVVAALAQEAMPDLTELRLEHDQFAAHLSINNPVAGRAVGESMQQRANRFFERFAAWEKDAHEAIDGEGGVAAVDGIPKIYPGHIHVGCGHFDIETLEGRQKAEQAFVAASDVAMRLVETSKNLLVGRKLYYDHLVGLVSRILVENQYDFEIQDGPSSSLMRRIEVVVNVKADLDVQGADQLRELLGQMSSAVRRFCLDVGEVGSFVIATPRFHPVGNPSHIKVLVNNEEMWW